MSTITPHPHALAVRNPLIRTVHCPQCGARQLRPCIALAGERAGTVMKLHHIQRAAAALPDVFPSAPNAMARSIGDNAIVSLALRFNPFRAWLRNPMLYGPICVLVMAALATMGRTYIYDLHDRLWIEEALTVGGIAILGISCGWYAKMMGWGKAVWVNRVVSGSAFVIAVLPMINALLP